MASLTVLAAITGLDESATGTFREVIGRLSESAEVSVVLGHVYDESDRETLDEMFDVDLAEPAHLDSVAEHNVTVQQLTGWLEERDIEYSVRGAIGDQTTELLNIADRQDVDFLLIAGRRRSPTGKAIFGSTAQEILLNSERPVIFVGREE